MRCGASHLRQVVAVCWHLVAMYQDEHATHAHCTSLLARTKHVPCGHARDSLDFFLICDVYVPDALHLWRPGGRCLVRALQAVFCDSR